MTDTLFDDITGFEEVVHFNDRRSGLEGVIAVHSTVLGPSLGGMRFRPYASRRDMLRDVLRLARGMTYKSAAAGLDVGGGKAVVNGDPATIRSEALLRAFGAAVNSLGGRYVTAEDVGSTAEDMFVVAEETPHVVGLPVEHGGHGDPSGWTALGVLSCIKATVAHREGSGGLAGRTVAVSGAGKVGGALVRFLVEEGCTVAVADVDEERVATLARELGVKPVPVTEIHRVEADVFAPCALGGVLTPATIAELGCRMVVGAANNQLEDDACADRLAERGIVYAPDFLANAGGVVHLSIPPTAPADMVRSAVLELGGRLADVLVMAEERGISTHRAAEEVAEARLRAATPPPPFALR